MSQFSTRRHYDPRLPPLDINASIRPNAVGEVHTAAPTLDVFRPSAEGDEQRSGTLQFEMGMHRPRDMVPNFTGAILRPQHIGVHDTEGQVGFDARGPRLRQRLEFLTRELTDDPYTIATRYDGP